MVTFVPAGTLIRGHGRNNAGSSASSMMLRGGARVDRFGGLFLFKYSNFTFDER